MVRTQSLQSSVSLATYPAPLVAFWLSFQPLDSTVMASPTREDGLVCAVSEPLEVPVESLMLKSPLT